jgi:hypothetical protein
MGYRTDHWTLQFAVVGIKKVEATLRTKFRTTGCRGRKRTLLLLSSMYHIKPFASAPD